MKKPSIKFYSALHISQRFIFLCSHLRLDTMLSVLFWRCIVRSERCSSCVPLSIKLYTPSFTFSLSSSSSRFTAPLNIISDLLTKECRFSSSQMTTVMIRNPQLLRTKSDHTAREAIQLLKESGFTENKLKTIIVRNPGILLLKVDRNLEPKLEYLKKIGLASQDIAHIIFHRPRLLHLSLENCLAPRILLLETLFSSKVSLCKALRTAPGLLTSNFQKQVKPKVEYVKNNLGILEGSTAFARALDAILSLKFETLEVKTKHMASLGLTQEEICQILKGRPSTLRMSTKKMTANIEFLIRTANLEPKSVALNPVILCLSLEKRLKPRYEVFKSLRTSPHAKGLPSLTQIFMLTEQAFLAKFSQYNTQAKSNEQAGTEVSI